MYYHAYPLLVFRQVAGGCSARLSRSLGQVREGLCYLPVGIATVVTLIFTGPVPTILALCFMCLCFLLLFKFICLNIKINRNYFSRR